MSSTQNAMKDMAHAMKDHTKGHFYPKQKTSAEEIVGHYNNDIRYVQLSAQMQSGKSGCAMFVAFDMLLKKKVSKVFIISGSAEIELRDQWRHNVELYIAKKDELSDEEEELLEENIKVIWRQDLDTSTQEFGVNYLIIWDESHFAVMEGSTLHRVYDSIGILPAMQGDASVLAEKNSYLLSVTATRGAEQSRYVGANEGFSRAKGWAMVVMTPGEGYVGVEHFHKNGLIRPSLTIEEKNMSRVELLISKYDDQKKYMIIRCQSSKDHLVEFFAAKKGYSVIKYNQETTKSKRGRNSTPVNISMLRKAPEKFTIILIRGMLRMGKELPKKHLCAVYEESYDPKSHTILQGLLGRVCGHHNMKIDIYLPAEFINDTQNGIERYIRIVQSNFKIGMTNVAFIPKEKVSLKQSNTPTRYTSVPMYQNSKSDEYTPMQERNNEQSREAIAKDLLRKINANQSGFCDEKNYTPDQKKEIIETLEQMKRGKNNCKIIKTHKKNTDKKKTIKIPMLKILNDSISKGMSSPIISKDLLESPIVILHINGNKELQDTGFSIGDWVVVFNTEAKPLKDKLQIQNDRVLSTNGKDIFTSKKDPKSADRVGIDVDGSQQATMKPETYTSPSLFSDSLSEAVTSSLSSTYLNVTKSMGSNYGKGSGKYKGISFSGFVYSWSALLEIFSNIEKMHNVKIRYDRVTKGKPPKNSNDIRLRSISWN